MSPLSCLLLALAALPGAAASLHVRDDVVNYDILSDSWVLPLELTQVSSRWDMVVPFACAHRNCSRSAFFDSPNPYMACGAVVGLVARSRTLWHHARAAQDACAHDLATCQGLASDWLNVRPPLSLYVRADAETLAPYTRDGAMTVRLLFVNRLDESNTTCQAESFDLAFRLPQHVTPLASVVATNPCVAAGMRGPPNTLLVRMEVPGAIVCVWKCHAMYMRRPWNAAPINASLACTSFPREFTAVIVALHLEVPRWWHVGELGQEFFDGVDELALVIEGHMAQRFESPTVACVVQGSMYDFVSLTENMQTYVAYEQREGFAYETVMNSDSMLTALRTDASDGVLRLECRVVTTDVLLQPETIKQQVTAVFNAVLLREAVTERLKISSVAHHDIEMVVRYCQTRAETPSGAKVRVYRHSMVFVEIVCMFVMALIIGSWAVPTVWTSPGEPRAAARAGLVFGGRSAERAAFGV